MSSQQREEKIYGAIDTEDFINFKGFCKKINSKQQHIIKIYIDDILKDTIESHLNIESVEEKYDMYDTNGFCFEYKIPENLIGTKHKIEFKTQDDNQLLNSPTQTAHKNSPNYNKYIFTKNMKNDFTEDKFKNFFQKNSIGFIAIEESINDKKFVEYIYELLNTYKNFSLKIFSFTDKTKSKIENLFKPYKSRIEIICPVDIYDVSEEIEIFINYYDYSPEALKYSNVAHTLNKYNKNIYVVFYDTKLLNTTLSDLDSRQKENHIFFNKQELFTFTEEEYLNANNSLYSLMFNQIISTVENSTYKIDLDNTYYQFRLIECINYALKNDSFKHYFFNLSQEEKLVQRKINEK